MISSNSGLWIAALVATGSCVENDGPSGSSGPLGDAETSTTTPDPPRPTPPRPGTDSSSGPDSNSAPGAQTCVDLPQHITADGLVAHLEALEAIATAHGNRRSVGTVGYDLSLDYVREQLEASGYAVVVHAFDVEVAGAVQHTASLLAETPGGNPDQVIVLGAHLDSVPTGPGINDNGSSVAALLEVARVIEACETNRKVRFAWWGAEEVRLAGSTAYVASLDDAQRSAIVTYMNFDMIGSPNYVRFIYDGDGSASGEPGPVGSAELEQVFAEYFDGVGLATEEIAFGRRSDYVAFVDAGIGAGGLFSGANAPKSAAQAQAYGGQPGVDYDPCYHAACDGIDNVDLEVLESMARAIAYAVEALALQ